MAAPLVAHGSKIGMHAIRPQQVIPLVRQAHARGLVWPLVKAVDNGGIAIDVKAIEPRTLTIVRFVNTQEDAAQDVAHMTPADMRAHARRALDFVWLRLSAQERAAADWIEPINEADPPGVDGWRAFGEYLKILVDEGNQRGMKLALPACNAGTPEWAEAQALVGTGVFAAIKAGGHILTLHEGVFGTDAVDKGFGDLIPGAPVVPGAGSLCFRYRYLYSLLSTRDELAPLVVSEFYGGGSYRLDPAEQVARFAWYDHQARQDAYVLAVLPFTIDPDDSWRNADYTYAYSAVLDYLAAEKDIPNATTATTLPPAPTPGADPDGGGHHPPDVPPVAQGTHRVTALKLNIREFPWVGGVTPPLVGTLDQGAAITVLGVYQPAGKPFGWGCISADGNQWVSMQWVEPLP